MATFVVRQSFTPPGGKRYSRGDVVTDVSGIPAALQARCLTPVPDDFNKPKPASAPKADVAVKPQGA